MNVDTADYDITNYNDGSLSATLSHEMTHLIMQDVLTSGMVGTNSEPYPLWFVEGMAQTASGDDGWLSGTLTSASSDSDIQNYLAQTASMPYGAGYLSTLYLAQMASGAGYGAGAVTTSSLQSGINTILGNLVQHIAVTVHLQHRFPEIQMHSILRAVFLPPEEQMVQVL